MTIESKSYLPSTQRTKAIISLQPFGCPPPYPTDDLLSAIKCNFTLPIVESEPRLQFKILMMF